MTRKMACLGSVLLSLTLLACGEEGDVRFAPISKRYVISTLRAPGNTIDAARNTLAIGFDIDGLVSTGKMPTTCQDAQPDAISMTDPDIKGVDNALGNLISLLANSLAEACPGAGAGEPCLAAVIRKAIHEGNLLLVVDVTNLESYRRDDVMVQLSFARVPGCMEATPSTCAPMLDGENLAAEQDFEIVTSMGAAVAGTIENGRLRFSLSQLAFVIPSIAYDLPFDMDRVQLRADISETALSRGAIGGALNVENLIAQLPESLPDFPNFRASAMTALPPVADLDPLDSDPLTCASMSGGLSFEAVSAASPD